MLSGTSVDGLDVAVADFDLDPDGTLALRPLHATTVSWPADLRRRVLAVLPPAPTTADELCRLDTEIGQFAGAAAAAAIATHGGDLVVSLGQTVFHRVEHGRALGTLQLGQPAWIVEATGLPVVSDLRARDVAAGGHGAPLASTLDALWLRGPSPRAALNLGGIANITVVTGAGDPVVAFDTGPANCLLDVLAVRASGGAAGHDVDGALARAGRVDDALLHRMLTEPYFAAAVPKSTGRELFTGEWLDAAVAAVHGTPDAIGVPDLAATLVELTARTVADACRGHGVTEVVGAGGGMHNPVLVERLAHHLAPVALRPSDELGLPVDAKEAYLVTLLGWLTWRGLPGVVAGGTGSPVARVLGRISPGDAPLRLPEPAAAPRALRVVA